MVANSKKDEKHRSIFHLSNVVVLPTTISLLFTATIVSTAGAHERASLFLWKDEALTKNDEGKSIICPSESIHSDDGVHNFLIFISCAAVFVSYIVMGATFLSKLYIISLADFFQPY